MACVVERHECTRNSNVIKHLGQAANLQLEKNEGFKNIYPWKKQCDEYNDYRHYIARSPSGIICGWMTAQWIQEFGQNYIYINEISTRRIKDELYGGIGRRLHAALIEDATASGAEFIYLFPLNSTVADVYTKWGYVHARPELLQMFLVLKAPPNNSMLDSLMPPNPRTFIVAAHELAMKAPKDDTLLALIEKVRRNIITKPDKIRELTGALEMIEGVSYMEEAENIAEDDRLSLDAKRDIIREVLERVKVGGSITRKHKHKNKSIHNGKSKKAYRY